VQKFVPEAREGDVEIFIANPKEILFHDFIVGQVYETVLELKVDSLIRRTMNTGARHDVQRGRRRLQAARHADRPSLKQCVEG
jgi:hypothetical protein